MLWTAPPPARNCQGRRDPPNVSYWHDSAVPRCRLNVRYRGHLGRRMLAANISGFDPERVRALPRKFTAPSPTPDMRGAAPY
jgi:hypothetical protein